MDTALDSIIKNCEAKKIPYWLYTFLRKGEELEQAKFMVKTCKTKIGKYFRGYILDVESGNTASGVKEALEYINGLGYKTMIYTMYAEYSTYKSVIANRGSNCAWWEARYGLNTGNYNSKYPPHSGVDLHQFTENGTCPGINDKIDLNRLTGKKSESWFLTLLEDKAPYSKITKDSDKTAIKWMQERLNKCYTGSLATLVVDGIWGKKTFAMLKAYWKQLGWDTTGTYCGEKTCNALYKGRKK